MGLLLHHSLDDGRREHPLYLWCTYPSHVGCLILPLCFGLIISQCLTMQTDLCEEPPSSYKVVWIFL